MAYEQVKRNQYFDPDSGFQFPHASRNHFEDLQEFHRPLERMHNTNLHDWGIAQGLEVSGTINGSEVVIHPGVALNAQGELIALSADGQADLGPNPSGDPHTEVPVPVQLPLASHTPASGTANVYVTIQYSEILRATEGSGGRQEQVPLVRLQNAAGNGAYVDDGSSIILAIAEINSSGDLIALKNQDSAVLYRRRLIGQFVEELRIQRSEATSNTVDGTTSTSLDETLSGKIGPNDNGGLQITVPTSTDSVVIAREDGGNFANLNIHSSTIVDEGDLSVQGTLTVHRDAYLAVSSGNVGIGTTAPQGKLDVEGDIRAGNSDLYFTKTDHNHTRVGNANGYAAIENAASHGALMILGRAGTSKGRYVRLWDYLQVNGGMDITGSVGIGTTSPSPGAKLDVRGNLYVGGRASIAGNNYWHRAQSTNDAHYGYFEVRRPTDNRRGCFLGWGQPGKYVDLRLEEGNDLAITGGNVGIGTSNPGNFKLNIGGTGGQNALHVASDFGLRGENRLHLIRFGSDGNYQVLHKASGAFGRNTLAMHVDANDAFGVYSTGWKPLLEIKGETGDVYAKGKVGIGTTSPSAGAKLDVRGNLYVGGRASIAGNNYWHRAQSTNDAHYGYFEVRRPTDNRRGCYLGYGQPGKYVDLRLEEGNDLAITGGNVSIGRWNPGYAKLEVWASGSTSCGLRTHTSLGPSGYGYGVHATAYGESGSRVYGLRAYAYGVGSGYRYGVHATAYRHSGDKGTCYAGYFTGDVNINGRLSKGAGSFLIDHPLDPLNKTLRHSFVESPENLCLYRGKIKLDSQGRATVEMPAYFPALTKEDEATVNLTAIGTQPFLLSFQWNQEHTAFTIFGSPDAEAAYLVLADRDDPVIHQLRQPVEQEKGNGNFEKEQLLYPQAYGYPQTMGFDYHQQEATGGN